MQRAIRHAVFLARVSSDSGNALTRPLHCLSSFAQHATSATRLEGVRKQFHRATLWDLPDEPSLSKVAPRPSKFYASRRLVIEVRRTRLGAVGKHWEAALFPG